MSSPSSLVYKGFLTHQNLVMKIRKNELSRSLNAIPTRCKICEEIDEQFADFIIWVVGLVSLIHIAVIKIVVDVFVMANYRKIKYNRI